MTHNDDVYHKCERNEFVANLKWDNKKRILGTIDPLQARVGAGKET